MVEKRYVVGNKSYWAADMIQNLSGPLTGDFKEWPSHIQDKIHNAIVDLCKATNRKYELYSAVCDHDIDQGYFVRAVARAPVLQ